jgi:hypothetical protein
LELVDDSRRMNNEAPVGEAGIRSFLADPANSAFLDFEGENLLEELQIEAQVDDRAFVMPKALEDLFEAPAPRRDDDFDDGTDWSHLDPREAARARLRGLPGSRWGALPRTRRWRAYVARELEAPDAKGPFGQYLREATDPEQRLAEAVKARARFAAALGEIEALATALDSPFAEAFRLAAACLESPSDAMPAPVEAMKAFSDTAKDVWSRAHDTLAPLFDLADREDCRRGLIAADIADVFGGMGSWNDIDPCNRGDDYARTSASLYAALRSFLASVT